MRAAVVLLLALSGCAGTTLYAHPAGQLWATDTFVHHGVDLSRAVIADDWFRVPEAIAEPLVRWNSAVADEAMEHVDGAKSFIDLRVSVDRNRSVGAVLLGDGAEAAIPGAALVTEEVAPYVNTDATGRGILTVIDHITRDGRVTGHTVVFERATGSILLVTAAEARGLGATPVVRYFHAFAKVARTGTLALARRLER